MITQEILHETFDYKNGKLYWKGTSGRRTLGKVAGSKNQNGYINICLSGKYYKGHRLIFLYHNGYLPEFIDHINGIRDDNRIENLREATRGQNQRNRKPTGTSKYMGVLFVRGKWRAQGKCNGKTIHIGYLDCEHDAALAYNLWCYNNLTEQDLEFTRFNVGTEPPQ